jgi:hypothetical protein
MRIEIVAQFTEQPKGTSQRFKLSAQPFHVSGVVFELLTRIAPIADDDHSEWRGLIRVYRLDYLSLSLCMCGRGRQQQYQYERRMNRADPAKQASMGV